MNTTALVIILLILLFVLYFLKSHNVITTTNEKNNGVPKIDTFHNLKPDIENYKGEAVLMVFLSKTCPYCVTYDKQKHDNLSKELDNHNIKIKKIYSDEDKDKLFEKHQIQFVPAAVLQKGDNITKVNGDINVNSVKNALNDIKSNPVQEVAKPVQEVAKPVKEGYKGDAMLMVFLSKTCPYCVTYDKQKHDNLAKELEKDSIKIKKIYSDEDKDKLFEKHQIQFVPAAVLQKGDNITKINGDINADNVKNTLNIPKVDVAKVDVPKVDVPKVDVPKVDGVEAELMVFLTRHCPHCVTYDKHKHDNLCKELDNHGIKIKKIYADEDPDNLFDKHEVQFVPTAILKKGDKVVKVNGEINTKNVKEHL